VKAIETTTDLPLADTEVVVRAALKDQGFGVLTEIDVAATLKDKLGVDRAPLKILGACNPSFAHRALMLDPTVGLLLPCNVVLETVNGGTHVAIADPRELMPGEDLAELANEAAAQLAAVIDALEGN
jgi:uncharacterized protein (DUF302 family)